MLIAPVLPLFAKQRAGKLNNDNEYGVEPRLPDWLSWFMTRDNSLWGDNGWKTIHRPSDYKTYKGMVFWLWRNPIGGFCWSVLAHKLTDGVTFFTTSSEAGFSVDKGQGILGWFFIKSSDGAFQYRKVVNKFGLQLSLEIGWMLVDYAKNYSEIYKSPLAKFRFSPKIVKAK